MESLKGIKTVFIYLRKSRDNGDGLESLDNHKRTLLEVCKRNNWNDIRIFEEIGTSQSIEARPVFKEMLEAVKNGEADIVLAMDADRLSRGSLGEWQTIKDTFRESATFFMNALGTVYNYNDIDSTFTSDLLSVLASYEYQQIKKRLQRGKKASHAMGNWVSGTPPLGYVYNRYTKKLDVDEERAKIYYLIKSMSLEGKTNGQISKELNRLGLKSDKGCKFTPTAVYRILTNPTYKGEIVLKRATGSHKDGTYKPLPAHLWEVTKNTHEALITTEEFDRIQKLMAVRNITPVNARRGTHALSGIVRCGTCGKLHSVTNSQTKGATSPSYVKPCRNCKLKGIYSDVLERAVLDEVHLRREQIKDGAPELVGRRRDLMTRIEAGQKAIDKANQGLGRLTDLFIDGLIDKDAYKQKQEELKGTIEGAEHEVKEAYAELENVKELEDVPKYLKRIEEFIQGWTDEATPTKDKNALLKGIVKSIVLTRNEAEESDIIIEIEFM